MSNTQRLDLDAIKDDKDALAAMELLAQEADPDGGLDEPEEDVAQDPVPLSADGED